MLHKAVLMELCAAGEHRCHEGDPETSSEVPEQVINRRGISHIFLFYFRHRKCCQRDKEKAHADTQNNSRPYHGAKIGKEVEVRHKIGGIGIYGDAKSEKGLRIYFIDEASGHG